MYVDSGNRERKQEMLEVRIEKDDFFATKKWFIVDTLNGFKWNVIGFKTKKAAIKCALAADAKLV